MSNSKILGGVALFLIFWNIFALSIGGDTMGLSPDANTPGLLSNPATASVWAIVNVIIIVVGWRAIFATN
jgi:hypothetical protein